MFKKHLKHDYNLTTTNRPGAVNLPEEVRKKMRYAVYFTWNDGFEDSFNVDSAKERDMNIKDMISRKEFKSISYCRIYASGEYGTLKYVL